MVQKATLQSYADDVLADAYRQPLKTVDEALAEVGWPIEDQPSCCGDPVETRAFLGGAYHAECGKCGRFIHDMTGPSFSENGGSCFLIDGEKVDVLTEHRWIGGMAPAKDEPK